MNEAIAKAKLTHWLRTGLEHFNNDLLQWRHFLSIYASITVS